MSLNGSTSRVLRATQPTIRLAQSIRLVPPFPRPISGASQATAREQIKPKSSIMLEDEKGGFGFIRHNKRPPKPRTVGVTEIRGPYYSAMGKRYLEDVFET